MDNPMGQIPQQTTQPTENSNHVWAHTRLGVLIVGVFVLTIFGKTCGRKKGTDNVPGQTVKIEKPGNLKIRTSNKIDTKTDRRSETKTITKFIPPEGSVTITPKDPTKSIDDLVKIHYQEMGWTFEPGLEFSGNLYYSYGIDAKLFYAYRFGLGAGLVAGSNVTTIISPDVFISYRLDQLHLRNTEAVVTYVPAAKIPFGLGLRINL